jgi:hypothetical protein
MDFCFSMNSKKEKSSTKWKTLVLKELEKKEGKSINQ